MDEEDVLQEDIESVPIRIRSFLSTDSEFRDPKFDPSPYLIAVLKDKEANPDLFYDKQKRLIQMENEAQLLMGEVAAQQKAQFIDLLNAPAKLGAELEGLKHGMASVKRKVRESKAKLEGTQRYLKQLHLNCLFNKLVYRKMKTVEVKMRQLETATLALKNHLYLDCAQNIPVLEGHSIIENALVARVETLKLRFLSQGIQELRIFLYFTPKLAIPMARGLFEGIEEGQQSVNQSQHEAFRKRYLLFKRADPLKYLSSIWQMSGLEDRKGKVGTVADIIKGVMRISRAQEITQSLILDLRKSIANVYMALTYFFSKQSPPSASQKKRWFTHPHVEHHLTFLSVVLCVTGAMIRKMLVVRMICNEYLLTQIVSKLSVKEVLGMAVSQITDTIRSVYFPTGSVHSTGQELLQDELADKLRHPDNYAVWPYFRRTIEQSLAILLERVGPLEQKLFDSDPIFLENLLNPFQECQNQFNSLFHSQFMRQVELIFPEGRGLMPQDLQSLLSVRSYTAQTLNLCSEFKSTQNKVISQFVNSLAFLNSLDKYFNWNSFQPIACKQYSLFVITYLYLKINANVHRYYMSKEKTEKVKEIRQKQGKVRHSQKLMKEKYGKFIGAGQAEYETRRQVKFAQIEQPHLRAMEQLKLIHRHLQMLLSFANQNYKHLQGSTVNDIQRYDSELGKHQPGNYEQNTGGKAARVWEQLIRPLESVQRSIDSLLAAVLRRTLHLLFVVSTLLYLQTGTLA